MEYLLNLVATLPTVTEGARPGPAEDERVRKLLQDVFNNALWYWASEAAFEPKDEKLELRFMAILRRLLHRGSSYPQHHRDLLLAVFGPHDALLRARTGFTSADLIAAEGEIRRQIEAALRAGASFFDRAADLRERFFAWLESDEARKHSSLEELRAEFHALPDVAEGVAKLHNLLADGALHPFRLLANECLSSTLLESLSLRPGENAAFLRPPIEGSPLNKGGSHFRPLLRIENQYYAFAANMLFRNLEQILAQGLRAADGQLEPGFVQARHKVLVDLAEKHLRALLPGCSSWHNLHFFPEPASGATEGEVDLLVGYDNVLLIVEAKGRTSFEAAQRGSLKAIESEIDRLLEKPFEQVSAAESYLGSAEEVSFFDSRGVEVLKVRRGEWVRRYRICVTLSDLSGFTAQLGRLQEVGVVSAGPLPWAVFINDLRVIAEILSSPSEFLLFLERRLRVNAFPQLRTTDELDFLMLFLHHGLYPTEKTYAGLDTYLPHGYTVELDRYYSFCAGRVSSGKKPELAALPALRSLVRAIEETGTRGFSEVGSFLLGLDAPSQRDLLAMLEALDEKWRADQRPHGAVFTFLEENVGIGIVVGVEQSQWPVSEFRKRHLLRKYQHRLKNWYSLCRSPPVPGDRRVFFEIIRGEWKSQADMERRLVVHQREALILHERRASRPGRNDPCPCGSGRKFKRCCLALVS